MSFLSGTVPLATAALLAEAALGYPDAVFHRIGHPVTWMGWLLAALERGLNRNTAPAAVRRLAGVAALLVLLLAVAVAGAGATFALRFLGWPGAVLLVLTAATLPAQRSLDRHVGAVAAALEREGLEGGRRAVSMIVGRNPATLDEAGVARAAIESLAENFSDGVVAPLLWMALGGLPGGALYKAANTADSMIGHRTPRHAAFGWAAARFDDLVNLPAARLAALWLAGAAVLTGAGGGAALRTAWRCAPRHRSPNAGWPEAAMAGALGLRLGGPRTYGDALVVDGYMGDGRAEAGAGDIRRALRLYRVACLLQGCVLVALSALLLA